MVLARDDIRSHFCNKMTFEYSDGRYTYDTVQALATPLHDFVTSLAMAEAQPEQLSSPASSTRRTYPSSSGPTAIHRICRGLNRRKAISLSLSQPRPRHCHLPRV